MQKLLITATVCSMIVGSASAETIKASVNGLVCAFCATGIEKTFKTEPAVEHIKVDLDSKLVTIDIKEGQKIDDATVNKLITDAGYTVTNIKREK
jgi:mercuric ion binding protein